MFHKIAESSGFDRLYKNRCMDCARREFYAKGMFFSKGLVIMGAI